jgi:hypothetical protein
MNFSLIFILLVFFFDFSLEDFEELWLQKHFLDGNKDLENHLKDFALGKFVSNSIRNHNLIVDKLISMKIDKIIKFIIDNFKFLSDKFFKQEDVSIFIDII